MDIKEIRRENLRELVEDVGAGKQVLLGEIIGKDPSLISQILQGTRNMGETLARDIEQQLNMKRGSMDEDKTKSRQFRQLKPTIPKREQNILDRLRIAAERGELSDDDLSLFEHVLSRLKKTPNEHDSDDTHRQHFRSLKKSSACY